MAIRVSRSISCFLLCFRFALLSTHYTYAACAAGRIAPATISLSLSLSLGAILINFYYFYKPWQQAVWWDGG